MKTKNDDELIALIDALTVRVCFLEAELRTLRVLVEGWKDEWESR